MLLEIRCPNCGKISQSDYERIPKGQLKTTCHQCQHQFPLNKETGLNAKTLRDSGATVSAAQTDGPWKVDHPICTGIDYDLAGLGGLIRSGLIEKSTRILEPRGQQWKDAGNLAPLQKFFEQRESKNKQTR